MLKFEFKEDKSVTEKALAKLRNIRIRMSAMQSSNNNTFYSFIAMSMTLIPDYSISTLGVKGKDLYFNPLFINGLDQKDIDKAKKEVSDALSNSILSQEEHDNFIHKLTYWYGKKTEADLNFFWRHEIEHIIRCFVDRKLGLGIDLEDCQKHKLLNIAQDYVINNSNAIELHNEIETAKRSIPILKYLYLDNKYIGKTTEEVYIDLLKEQQSQGSGGSKSQGSGELLDEHFDFSDEEVENIKGTIIKAAKQAGIEGTPNDVWKIVDELFKPKIKWSTLLDKQLKSFYIKDMTYEVPHTRSRYMTNYCRNKGYISNSQHLVFPTEEVDGKIYVVLAFDTSGSISKREKLKMLSEAAGIVKQFNDFELSVFCWGTDVVKESVKHFTPANIKELYSYEFLCGGGTSIKPTTDYLINNFPKHQAVVFTDGYFFDSIPRDKTIKTLSKSIWVLFNNQSFKSPIGKTVHYESENK